MSEVRVSQTDGRLVLEGELDFSSVVPLREAVQPLLETGADVRIDLQGITRSDSAGLALLIEWMRHARRLGKSIEFLNIPAQMRAIAQVSNLDQVLPLDHA